MKADELTQSVLGVVAQMSNGDFSGRIEDDRFEDDESRGLALAINMLIEELEERQQKWSLAEGRARRLAALVDSSSDAILRNSRDGTITEWNAGAERMYGYCADEIVGDSVLRLVPEDRQLEITQIWKEISQGRRLDPFETVRLTKDGRSLQILLSVSPVIEHGEITGVSAIAHDVSQAHELSVQLRKAEAKYRDLYDHAPDMYFSVDAQTWAVAECNETACRILARSRAEMIGLPLARLLSHESLEPAREAHARTIESGKVEGCELIFRRADGAPVYVELSSTGERDETGRVTRTRSVLRDIEQRVRMRHDLEARREELERSNEELEQFAYVASHDLQEPLRMVASFTELLREKYRGQLDERADRYIDFAADGARRMQRLIRGLLDYSRAGRDALQVQPHKLAGIVTEAAADFKLEFEARGVDFGSDVDPSLEVAIDRVHIVRVVGNLLSNAVKFSPGVRPRIRVSASVLGDCAELCVADQGIGIAPEQQGRVFEMFQRLQRREDYPGDGIGLAMCRRIVNRHQGDMRIVSKPGEGTQIFFTLPLAVDAR